MTRMLKFMHISKLKGKINKNKKFQCQDFHLVESAVQDMELLNLVNQVLLHQKLRVLIWVLLDKLNKSSSSPKEWA